MIRYESYPVIHDIIQTWLCHHLLSVRAYGILGVLTVIVTLSKQFSAALCCHATISVSTRWSFSLMVDLVSGEFAISITPLSQATIGLIQEYDTTSFVVDQLRYQVLLILLIEVLACSSKVEIISLKIFVSFLWNIVTIISKVLRVRTLPFNRYLPFVQSALPYSS